MEPPVLVLADIHLGRERKNDAKMSPDYSSRAAGPAHGGGRGELRSAPHRYRFHERIALSNDPFTGWVGMGKAFITSLHDDMVTVRDL